jgi:hypothetical protein
MSRATLAGLAALAIGGFASTEDAAIAEFRAAVEKAESHADERYAFTLDYRDLGAKEQRTFRVRFDPRRPAGARWAAIDPPEDQYGKEEKAAFERMTRNDEADDALVYEGLADAVPGAALVSADAEQAVFSIPINDPDAPKAMKEALTATAVLDRRTGHVASVEIRATKPFKPAAPVKINAMRQLQRYEILSPGGPALMIASESDAEGSAMFKSFSSKVRIAYSEIEKVEAPPRAASK